MATWYTDIAQNQRAGLNFPGQTGETMLTTQPGVQNDPLKEGPPLITATYTWTGSEAVSDIINIALIQSGLMVQPQGTVCSGVTAPAGTLTVSIGDNDLGDASGQVNPNSEVAPLWVTGTTYAVGDTVRDATTSPANKTFIRLIAGAGATAPVSDTTNWAPCASRYSTSISIAAASAEVLTTGGSARYMGYEVEQDCWLQATILTQANIVAGTVSVFRFNYRANN